MKKFAKNPQSTLRWKKFEDKMPEKEQQVLLWLVGGKITNDIWTKFHIEDTWSFQDTEPERVMYYCLVSEISQPKLELTEEKKEKYTFFKAQEIVVGTERRIEFDGVWYTFMTFQGVRSVALLPEGKNATDAWWPTPEQQKEKAWEVEPEKQKEIIVWGACDENGKSYIYQDKPDKIEDVWETRTPLNCLYLNQQNLFPKDKPQKFKLMRIDD